MFGLGQGKIIGSPRSGEIFENFFLTELFVNAHLDGGGGGNKMISSLYCVNFSKSKFITVFKLPFSI